MQIRWKAVWITVLFLVFLCPHRARAAEVEDYDFSEIQEILTDSGSESISFSELVEDVVNGEIGEIPGKIGNYCMDLLFGEIRDNKSNILKVVVIAAFGTFFTTIASVFKNSQVSETGFYITYLLMITILAGAFVVAAGIAKGFVSNLLSFMMALLPTFFLAVSYAGGGAASLSFYQFTLFAISGVEWIFLRIVLPLIEVYVILMLVNHISKEDYLSKLAGLLKTAVEWIMKTMLGLVIGMNLIQGMILPLVDTVKTSAVRKVISVIPGIGSGADAVTEVVLGSGILIKNGIGVAALVILVILCAMPVLKLTVLSLLYHGAAAVVQPVSDKRITESVSGVADGVMMLLKVIFHVALLFIITVAVVCVSTNAMFYAG